MNTFQLALAVVHLYIEMILIGDTDRKLPSWQAVLSFSCSSLCIKKVV